MSTKYFTGAKPHHNSDEFRSKPASSLREALEVAMMASKSGYSDITMYAQREERTVSIPFTEIERIEKQSDLEFLINIIGAFNKKFGE